MPFIRSLFMAAARRAASDPEMRAKAGEAARSAARRAGEQTRGARETLDEEIDRAFEDAPEDATRAEIAGRVTRRLFDRMKGDD